MKNRGKWLSVLFMVLCCIAFSIYVLLSNAERDKTAPVIKLSEDTIEVSVKQKQQVLLSNATAWDNEDGNVTSSIIIESVSDIFDKNRATVTYAAFDSAGNVAKTKCTVVYTDYQGSRFTLSAPLLFREGSRFDVFEVIGAEDEIDGDLSNQVKGTLVSGGTEISKEGEYKVSFRVTNSLGDTVYLDAPVEVVDAGKNVSRLALREYLVYLKANTVFKPEDYLESTDSRIRMDSDVNMGTPGVYSVTYSLNSDVTRLLVIVEE